MGVLLPCTDSRTPQPSLMQDNKPSVLTRAPAGSCLPRICLTHFSSCTRFPWEPPSHEKKIHLGQITSANRHAFSGLWFNIILDHLHFLLHPQLSFCEQRTILSYLLLTFSLTESTFEPFSTNHNNNLSLPRSQPKDNLGEGQPDSPESAQD